MRRASLSRKVLIQKGETRSAGRKFAPTEPSPPSLFARNSFLGQELIARRSEGSEVEKRQGWEDLAGFMTPRQLGANATAPMSANRWKRLSIVWRTIGRVVKMDRAP
jgi:hypothetical protein